MVSRKRLGLGLGVLVMLSGGPASASTIPPLKADDDGGSFSLGLNDLSWDFALGEGVTLGVTGATLADYAGGAVRLTWRVLGFGGAPLLDIPLSCAAGLTLSGGYSQPLGKGKTTQVLGPAGNIVAADPAMKTAFDLIYNPPSGSDKWLQPALNLSVGVGRLYARGTLGPMLYMDRPGFSLNGNPSNPFYLILPNVELGVLVGRSGQLTVGGNGLIGWRWLW